MNELNLFSIFISGMIINNIVLIWFIGLCSFLRVSVSLEASTGMGIAIIFVTTISSAVSWIVYNYLLKPYNLEFLKIIVFVLFIALFIQLVAMFIKKNIPGLLKSSGNYFTLITANCVMLAVAFLQAEYRFNFIQSLVFSLGISCGFALAVILFVSIRERLELAPVPKALKGYPLSFFIAALMSLAFMGFRGLFGL